MMFKRISEATGWPPDVIAGLTPAQAYLYMTDEKDLEKTKKKTKIIPWSQARKLIKAGKLKSK